MGSCVSCRKPTTRTRNKRSNKFEGVVNEKDKGLPSKSRAPKVPGHRLSKDLQSQRSDGSTQAPGLQDESTNDVLMINCNTEPNLHISNDSSSNEIEVGRKLSVLTEERDPERSSAGDVTKYFFGNKTRFKFTVETETDNSFLNENNDPNVRNNRKLGSDQPQNEEDEYDRGADSTITLETLPNVSQIHSYCVQVLKNELEASDKDQIEIGRLVDGSIRKDIETRKTHCVTFEDNRDTSQIEDPDDISFELSDRDEDDDGLSSPVNDASWSNSISKVVKTVGPCGLGENLEESLMNVSCNRILQRNLEKHSQNNKFLTEPNERANTEIHNLHENDRILERIKLIDDKKLVEERRMLAKYATSWYKLGQQYGRHQMFDKALNSLEISMGIFKDLDDVDCFCQCLGNKDDTKIKIQVTIFGLKLNIIFSSFRRVSSITADSLASRKNRAN